MEHMGNKGEDRWNIWGTKGKIDGTYGKIKSIIEIYGRKKSKINTTQNV